jgi:hypothetical protein
MKRIRVDFNARDARDLIPIAHARLGEDAVAGDTVEVYDGEEGFYGPARIVDIDGERGLAYLDVAWTELRDPDPMPRVDVNDSLDLVIFSHEGVFIVQMKSDYPRSTLTGSWAPVEQHPGHNTRIAGYVPDEDLIAS